MRYLPCLPNLRRVGAAALAVVLFAAACGRSGGEVATTAADPGPPPSRVPAATTPDPAPSADPPSGVAGVDITPPATAGTVAVVADTVAVDAGARAWTARGLVRNDTAEVAAQVVVTAELLDDGGGVLERIEVVSPVHDVRPGEPVPFSIVASSSASSVAGVRWSARADGVGDPTRRALALATFWTRSYGDPRPVRIPLRQEAPDGPRPFLAFGSVTAGGVGIAQPAVVAVWTDGDGRVRDLRVAPAAGPDGNPVASLARGAAADWLLVVDDPVLGPAAAASTPLLWGTSR